MSRTHDISIRSGDDGEGDDELAAVGAAGVAGAAAGLAAGADGDDALLVEAATAVDVADDGEDAAAAALLAAEAGVDDDDDDNAVLAWLFLAGVFGVFLILALWSMNGEDELAVDATPSTTVVDGGDGEVALTPAALVFQVDGDTVTLTGSVPDEETRAQLVSFAEARFGTVIDELVVDDSTTLTGGTLSVVGTGVEGDPDPAGLQADAAVLGLEAGDFDVTFEAGESTPVDAEVAVASSLITLSGSFPDQATLDQFVADVESVYGAGNVDSSGLTVDPDTTMNGSTIRITGLADAGDTRGEALQAALAGFFGGSTIDASGLTFDTSAEALGRLEDELTAELAASPILFNTGSFDVDDFAENQAILERAAAAINAAPGVAVEVVGHTDTSGDAGTNQLLSEDRANAVLDRLVELGVDADRLTARGAGETEPLPEVDGGAAENRRIVFEFEGATSADDAADDETADEESDEG
ncbi:MAG: OmpA family protein [Acidimicrobiales bacterium]